MTLLHLANCTKLYWYFPDTLDGTLISTAIIHYITHTKRFAIEGGESGESLRWGDKLYRYIQGIFVTGFYDSSPVSYFPINTIHLVLDATL